MSPIENTPFCVKLTAQDSRIAEAVNLTALHKYFPTRTEHIQKHERFRQLFQKMG